MPNQSQKMPDVRYVMGKHWWFSRIILGTEKVNNGSIAHYQRQNNNDRSRGRAILHPSTRAYSKIPSGDLALLVDVIRRQRLPFADVEFEYPPAVAIEDLSDFPIAIKPVIERVRKEYGKPKRPQQQS